jgi:hypothetical protein
MNKEKHIAELEKILKEHYPLLPLESIANSSIYTIKDLAQEFNKEVERRFNTPFLPGIDKNWNTIFLDTLEALKMDKKGYLKKVYNNIHPENKELRENLKTAINNE